MMKYLSLLAVTVLIGAGCATSPSETLTTINGEIIVGRFGGTEKACGFAKDAQIGDSVQCNSGTVAIGVNTEEDGVVWLTNMQCDAIEIFTRTENGVAISYETSNCDADLSEGASVEMTGILNQRKDQWYNGVQQDEWWMTVK